MKLSNFERLVSNEKYFEAIIHHFQMNKESVQIHNNFASLVRQLKDCVHTTTMNPRISTLEMFLRNNMPSLEKHTELIWNNFNINRRAVEVEEGLEETVKSNSNNQTKMF